MADRPILFSAPMIRALLEGRKTQTRRILNPQPEPDFIGAEIHEAGFTMRPAALFGGDAFKALRRVARPGDRLYVREAWRTLHANDCLPPRLLLDDPSKITFEADPERRNPLWAFGKLRPGIHMPRWASRLTAIVTEVRVQRLQEISEEDAIAEGIDDRDVVCGYSELWDQINGPGAWEANPWVAAITFTVHRANIDALGKEAA